MVAAANDDDNNSLLGDIQQQPTVLNGIINNDSTTTDEPTPPLPNPDDSFSSNETTNNKSKSFNPPARLNIKSVVKELIRGRTTSSMWKAEGLDPFQVFEVEHESCLELNITIHGGADITKGSVMSDLIDTPDPYVVLKIPGSSNKSQRTTQLDNCTIPTWNETFQFFLDPGKEHTLHVTLMDANYTLDETLGEDTFIINTLTNDIPLKHTFHFSGGSKVFATMVLTKNKEPDLRFSLALCEKEREFLQIRRKKVLLAMDKLLGDRAPQRENQVPIMAVLGSGGGFRAMMCMSGAVRALHETGVLDCATYISGLSGSSWYISHLYSHDSFGYVTPDEISSEIRDAVTSGWKGKLANTPFYLRSMWKKYRQGQPVSFTDFFGHLLGDVLLKGRKDTKLTDQRTILAQGTVPFPLYTCLHAKREVTCKDFSEWVEFSPYEIGIAKYGTFMKSEHFGSKFLMGKLIKQHPEAPLHFLQGVWGSAFTILVKRLVLEGNTSNKDAVQLMRENATSERDFHARYDRERQNAAQTESDTDDDDDIVGADDCSLEEDDEHEHHKGQHCPKATVTSVADNMKQVSLDVPEKPPRRKISTGYLGKAPSVKEISVTTESNSVDETDKQVDNMTCSEPEMIIKPKETLKVFEAPRRKKSLGDIFKVDSGNENNLTIGDKMNSLKKGFSFELPGRKKSKENMDQTAKSMNSALPPSDLDVDADERPRLLRKGAMKGSSQNTAIRRQMRVSDSIHRTSAAEKWAERRRTVRKQREEKKGLLSDFKDSILTGNNMFNTRAGRAGEVLNPFRGLSLRNSFPLSPFLEINKKESPPVYENDAFTLGADSRYEPLDNTAKKLFIVDSGLAFNSPYPLLLRPQRAVDIYLSFDFSYRKSDNTLPFKELILAEKWACQNKVPFPPVEKQAEQYKEDGFVREVYVFKNDKDPLCPVILHFPLVNHTFRTYKEPGVKRTTEEDLDFGDFKIFDDPTNVYASTNFLYEDIQFERMTKLTEYNTRSCLNVIKEELALEVERKKKKIAQCMNMEAVALMALREKLEFPQTPKDSSDIRLSIAEDRKQWLLQAKQTTSVESDSSEYTDAAEYLDDTNLESSQL